MLWSRQIGGVSVSTTHPALGTLGLATLSWLGKGNKALPVAKQRSSRSAKTHPALCTLGTATPLMAPHPAPHSTCATPDHSLQQDDDVRSLRPAVTALAALSCKEAAAAV